MDVRGRKRGGVVCGKGEEKERGQNRVFIAAQRTQRVEGDRGREGGKEGRIEGGKKGRER